VTASANALVFLGCAVGAPLAGLMAEKLQRCRSTMVVGAVLTLILMLIIIYLSLPWWLVMSLMFLLGLASGAYVLPFSVVRKVTCDTVHAAAMGFTNMLCILIGAFLQPLIGYLLTKISLGADQVSTAAYQTAFIPLQLSLVLAVVCSLLVKEKP
jgi:MFS family permease